MASNIYLKIDGIKGRENSKHNWNVGAGIQYTCGRLDLGVKYDFYGRADYTAHRVLGTVGISF